MEFGFRRPASLRVRVTERAKLARRFDRQMRVGGGSEDLPLIQSADLDP
jgi:hypothetical protein